MKKLVGMKGSFLHSLNTVDEKVSSNDCDKGPYQPISERLDEICQHHNHTNYPREQIDSSKSK